jgi:hypothetical protein
MFKVLVLQTLYTLSDEATEFQIRDRLSFMRFLHLELEDSVPDAKTIWRFVVPRRPSGRGHLTPAGVINTLFAEFEAWLKRRGHLAMAGQIVDASIIAARRQRTTDDEKAALKEGRILPAWRRSLPRSPRRIAAPAGR